MPGPVLNPDTPEQSDAGRERRSSRRRPLAEIPAITGVIVQAESVEVIDAAAGGLLIQSHLRLAPGTRTRLEIGRATDDPLNVVGCVVRSEVAGIASGRIQYRSAIALEQRLDFIDHDPAGEVTTAPLAGNFADFIVCVDADRLESEDSALNRW